jgi:hypothetical protein
MRRGVQSKPKSDTSRSKEVMSVFLSVKVFATCLKQPVALHVPAARSCAVEGARRVSHKTADGIGSHPFRW